MDDEEESRNTEMRRLQKHRKWRKNKLTTRVSDDLKLSGEITIIIEVSTAMRKKIRSQFHPTQLREKLN